MATVTNRLVTLEPDTYANTANGVTGSRSAGTGFYNITMGLVDNALYGPITSGGWQVVDRPKQVSATQWMDRAPYKLEFTGILDSSVTAPTGSSSTVETDCAQLELWMEPLKGLLEPPSIKVDGPLPGTSRTWVLFAIEFQDAIRDFTTGLRIQQQVKITLYEYNPPLATATHISNYSPADAWTQNNLAGVNSSKNPTPNLKGTPLSFAVNTGATNTSTAGVNTSYAPNLTKPSYKLYVVKNGDTLDSIVGKMGADYGNQILAVNGIRDPAVFQYMLGETIILP